MPDTARDNEPKIDPLELAKDLLKHAESAYAKSGDLYNNKRDYKASMRKALDSIEFSTQLMRLLFDMDFEHEPPGSAWFGQLMEAVPRKSADDQTAKLFKTIAGELFHATKRAVTSVIEECIS